jgi:hypothetical protein
MERSDVMTTEHPRWDELIGRLEALLLEGVEHDAEKLGNCDGTLSKAKTILKPMGGIDVDASLEYLRSKGGHCDCEIIYNIALGPFPNEEDKKELSKRLSVALSENWLSHLSVSIEQIELRCKSCGGTFMTPVPSASGSFPRDWHECPRGCNKGAAKTPAALAVHHQTTRRTK